jgi:hypothetical protein
LIVQAADIQDRDELARIRRRTQRRFPWLTSIDTDAGYQNDLAAHAGAQQRRRFEIHKRSRDAEAIPSAVATPPRCPGRSIGAERIDLGRYTAWHEMPIPHQPSAIAPLTAQSWAQNQNLQPGTPPSTIDLAGPPSFPDPQGLAAVLQAIQNGSMFRDMSKAGELAGILGNLSELAGQMGQAATPMTGDAAEHAMQAAVEMGKTAAKLSEQLIASGAEAPKGLTRRGGRLDRLRELQEGAPPGTAWAESYRKSEHDLLRPGGDVVFARGEGGPGQAPRLPEPPDAFGREVREGLGIEWRPPGQLYADLAVPFELPRDWLRHSLQRHVLMDPEESDAAAWTRTLADYFRQFVEPRLETSKASASEATLAEAWQAWRGWTLEIERRL